MKKIERKTADKETLDKLVNNKKDVILKLDEIEKEINNEIIKILKEETGLKAGDVLIKNGKNYKVVGFESTDSMPVVVCSKMKKDGTFGMQMIKIYVSRNEDIYIDE